VKKHPLNEKLDPHCLKLCNCLSGSIAITFNIDYTILLHNLKQFSNKEKTYDLLNFYKNLKYVVLVPQGTVYHSITNGRKSQYLI